MRCLPFHTCFPFASLEFMHMRCLPFYTFFFCFSDTNFHMSIEQDVLHVFVFVSSSCAKGKMRERQRQFGDDGGKPSLPVSQLTLLDNNGERVFPHFLDAAVSESCGSHSLNAARHAAASNDPVVIPKCVPPLPPMPWRLQLPQLPQPVMAKQWPWRLQFTHIMSARPLGGMSRGAPPVGWARQPGQRWKRPPAPRPAGV